MIEIILAICVIMTLVSACVSAYYFADARAKQTFIEKQAEIIENLRTENRDYLNKLLLKNGSTVLGAERIKPDTKVQTPAQTIVTGAMLRARATLTETEDTPEKPQTITLPTEKVGYPRVNQQRAVEKAGEILNK